MFENQNGIKLFEGKLDFWNSFEKLESRKLFKENWDFRVYLKIGLSGIKCGNENFKKLNLNEVGNFENDLRVRDFKWGDEWMSE